MTEFKGSNGKHYTRQLFWEESIELTLDQRIIEPVFTLYKDKPNLINFGKAYVQSRDPTGYKVTQDLLDGDYRHWQMLMKAGWFRAAKKTWDEEMDALLKSEAMTQIHELMKEGLPAQRLAAAKYLANHEYKKDKSSTKGRPKKEDIEAAAREVALVDKELQEDYNRIRLVKG